MIRLRAHNIAAAVDGFRADGYARFGGLIQNSRNVEGEDGLVDRAAREIVTNAMTPIMMPSIVRYARCLLLPMDFRAILSVSISSYLRDLTVQYVDAALSLLGNIRVVCDENDGISLAVELFENIHDLFTCL